MQGIYYPIHLLHKEAKAERGKVTCSINLACVWQMMDLNQGLISISVVLYKVLPGSKGPHISPQSIKLCPGAVLPPKTNIWKTVS